MKELIEKIVNRLQAIAVEEPLTDKGVKVGMIKVLPLKMAVDSIQEEAEAYNESVEGDLISRSQVIKTIWNLFNNWGNNAIRFSEDETRLINTAFQMVQRDIEKLPTAYNDEWIPVSIGKYPEAEEEVLICDDMNNLYIGYLRNVGFYVNDGDGWIDKKYVIAWKPLPPAYQRKESSYENENIRHSKKIQ